MLYCCCVNQWLYCVTCCCWYFVDTRISSDCLQLQLCCELSGFTWHSGCDRVGCSLWPCCMAECRWICSVCRVCIWLDVHSL